VEIEADRAAGNAAADILADMPVPDIVRLTESLDRHGVDFLVSSGMATLAYGADRPTGDLHTACRSTCVGVLPGLLEQEQVLRGQSVFFMGTA